LNEQAVAAAAARALKARLLGQASGSKEHVLLLPARDYLRLPGIIARLCWTF